MSSFTLEITTSVPIELSQFATTLESVKANFEQKLNNGEPFHRFDLLTCKKTGPKGKGLLTLSFEVERLDPNGPSNEKANSETLH